MFLSPTGDKRRYNAASSQLVETWPIKDVVFIYDGNRNDIGKVITIDGDKCGVVFRNNADVYDNDPAAVLRSMRLFRRDELVPAGAKGQSDVIAASMQVFIL